MPEQQMSEEQVKELQEKIKNMSPEELKEFQKKQCIFCHIIEGKVQSKKIYEDDKCLAILDINPSNPGHILLLPKEHYSIMPQVPEDEIAHLFMITKTLSNAALRGLGVQGTNIIVQHGVAAGQKAQHFMVHIIPRKEEDGLNFDIPQKKIPEEELEEIRKKMASQLGEVKEQAPKPNVQKLIKPRENVVEADFEESQSKKTEEKPRESEERDEPKKKEEIKPEEKEPKKSAKKPTGEETGEVSLDNIADILGVK